jgi:hypothetical protein
MMTDKVVTSKICSVMYVILSKAEKNVPLWKLVAATEISCYHRMYDIIVKVSHKPRSI